MAALSIMGVQISLTKKGVAHWKEVLEILYAQIALLKASDLSAAADDARASDALGFRYSPKAPPPTRRRPSPPRSACAPPNRAAARVPPRRRRLRRPAHRPPPRPAHPRPHGRAAEVDDAGGERHRQLHRRRDRAALRHAPPPARPPHCPPRRLAAPPASPPSPCRRRTRCFGLVYAPLRGSPGRHEPPALADGATTTRRLWHLADTTYKLPTAEVRVRWAVRSRRVGGGRGDGLSPLFDPRRAATIRPLRRRAGGISADVSPSTFGFEVDASGFSQRLPEAVRRAVAAVTSMQISEDELAIAKEKYARALAATLTEQPAERASQLTSKVLAEVAYLPAERSSALQNVTPSISRRSPTASSGGGAEGDAGHRQPRRGGGAHHPRRRAGRRRTRR